MACSSCASAQSDPSQDPRWRRVLWLALAINLTMFVAEIIAGVAGGSKALQADAMDFLGDSANYAISLGVAGMALAWRARAAALKGITLIALGGYILLATLIAVSNGALPHADVMGVIGVIAIIANGAVALMLFKWRSGDANMRSVWICSRNDVIGNLAVVLAAAGVFGTGTRWPDLIVAAVMATLALWGGWQIVAHARRELIDVSPGRTSATATHVAKG